MKNKTVIFLLIVLILIVVWLFRYKTHFIQGTGIVARYDRWTGKVSVIKPEEPRSRRWGLITLQELVDKFSITLEKFVDSFWKRPKEQAPKEQTPQELLTDEEFLQKFGRPRSDLEKRLQKLYKMYEGEKDRNAE